MLIYLANASRDYYHKPVEVLPRRGWEFQAVIHGSISLVEDSGPHLFRKNHLWLSAPSHPHGWTGEKNRPAKVIVFHFLFVPEVIEHLARPTGRLELPLSHQQCLRLSELADQAALYWQHPSLGTTICFEHVLLELSMLILAHHKTKAISVSLKDAERRVSAAIDWFTERVAQNPGLDEVARAVGTSPSNLRRIFCEVLQNSPKQVFDQIRYQRAMQLMSKTDIKLETVGESCGFGSASSFSRAFKAKFGCSPDIWRSSN